MSRPLRWSPSALLVCLVGWQTCFTLPVAAQSASDSGMIVNAMTKGVMARTICVEGSPMMQFSKPSGPMDAREAGALAAHEEVHVRQLTEDSTMTCEAKLAWVRADPARELEWEAEAYCVEAAWVEAHGGPDRVSTIGRVTMALSQYFAGHLAPGDVAHALMQHCPIDNLAH